MVQVRYFAPAPRLRGLVSSYYWCETDQPLLRDRMRAELGQIRFVVAGSLSYNFPDNRQVDGPCALLSGPTSAPVATCATGPFKCFGAGLMPAGWSAMIGANADTLADDAVELRSVVGAAADEVGDRLVEAPDDAARVAAADAFFIRLLDRPRSVPLWFLRLTDDWLTATPDPRVDVLVAASGMSARQVERWSRRHYGASPKLLARKYRALQAAVRLGTGEARGWAEAAGDAFYDQSHFIREFKQFVGMTPARFLIDAAPVSRVTIARRRLLPGMPRLALCS